MDRYVLLTRPPTLIEGEQYIYRDGQDIDNVATTEVEFIAYTSCPAIVVVREASGQRVRCPRDNLFSERWETYSGINGVSNEPG